MLRNGYRWQVWLAGQLEREGFATEVEPLRVRPSLDQRQGYGDTCDVRVFARSGGSRKLACKARRTRFTCPDDYPHPRVIVDSVVAWDRTPDTSAVVVISQYTAGIVVVPATSQEHWRVRSFPTPDGHKPCYWLPKFHCRTFISLCEWLEST
jgi:hypothetical protein